jgi:ketosteroid isomerase-like protein
MTATNDVQADHRELLLQAYAAYNHQDVDALLALVSDDVDWPDDGGRLHGKAALRTYWTEQWTRTHTHDEPVRSLDGSIVSQSDGLHLHRIEGMRISRLDIEAPLKP